MKSDRWFGRVLVFGLSVVLAGGIALATSAEETEGEAMSYGEARQYLVQHTQVVELTDGKGARVLITPDWQGRVMTSSCDGLDGLSYGFINKAFIDAGKPDVRFNNYGGEDRFWLSPEGGQFSLWFKKGAEQNLDNWYTPPALNEGAWKVVSKDSDPFYRMVREMEVVNASGTKIRVDVTRDVRLLTSSDLESLFGSDVAAKLADDDVKTVAYETINRIVNRGEPMTKDAGLVSIWILGMMNAGPQTVVIVPYKQGDEAELGPVVQSDYFGEIPPERLKILPEAILFLGDGNYRSKIGTSQKRAKNVLGSMDFKNNVLTIVSFTMPDDPTKALYMNNLWELPQEKPYQGDVANSYNDGPAGPDKPGLGPFYEIESLSPAKELKTGESLVHHHRTLHIQGDYAELKEIAKAVLGVDLDTVRATMFGN
ncbi:hypothetical protein JCM19992_00590 [Thermostilla marina]